MPIIGLDTAPLDPSQLSPEEIDAINEIELRLDIDLNRPFLNSPSEPNYEVPLLKRDPRVLLLDGERGTGKTSLLLTLMKRWRGEWKTSPESLNAAPTHITLVGNLDFDPLPPGMPLIAGLVQAWKPIVDALEHVLPVDDIESSLADRWHSLFRMAASGWSEVGTSRGLIDQVLDREDQVADWLKLSEKWREFVDAVAYYGSRQGDRLGIADNPVFVIIIDDCDLQVTRIGELLPALRNLYHDRVFFLVAADSKHMIDMLKLDFFGQQSKLGPIKLEDRFSNRWPTELAYATFEKVFARDNQWELSKLSLKAFLAYPEQLTELLPGEQTFYGTLTAVSGENPHLTHADGTPRPEGSVGTFLWDFACEAEKAHLPGVMTYRAANQLWKVISRFRHKTSPEAGLQVLRALFSGRSDSERAIIQDDYTIDVPITCEIASLFRPRATEFARYDFVFGTRPDFSYRGSDDRELTRMSRQPNLVNWTALLAAKALEEKSLLVDAGGVRWDTYLSLAWTEWQRPPASFLWNRHQHPRPDEVLVQAKEWARCVRKLGYRSDDTDRFAYAWIYYQIKWSSHPPDSVEFNRDLSPLELKKDGLLPWDKLLETEPSDDAAYWKTRTLPLLARPEIGFSVDVQKRLLKQREEGSDYILKMMRRRYVTNAVIAHAAQRGGDVTSIVSDEDIEGYIGEIESEFCEKNGVEQSPWRASIEGRKPRARTP